MAMCPRHGRQLHQLASSTRSRSLGLMEMAINGWDDPAQVLFRKIGACVLLALNTSLTNLA